MSLTQATREVNDPDTPWPVRLQAGLWGLALHLQPGQSLPLPRVLLTAFDGDLRRRRQRPAPPHPPPCHALSGRRRGSCPRPPSITGSPSPTTTATGVSGPRSTPRPRPASSISAWTAAGSPAISATASAIGARAIPKNSPTASRPSPTTCAAKGQKYGTWIEPEWANKDSEIYRDHPDWFWETPERPPVMRPGFHFQHPEFRPHQPGPARGAPVVAGPDRARLRGVGACAGFAGTTTRTRARTGSKACRTARSAGARSQHVQGLYQVLDDILEACPELFIEHVRHAAANGI